MLIVFDTGQLDAVDPHRTMCCKGRLQLQVYITKKKSIVVVSDYQD